jgi:hypothetical protein
MHLLVFMKIMYVKVSPVADFGKDFTSRQFLENGISSGLLLVALTRDRGSR